MDDITRAGGMDETDRCSGVQGVKHLMEGVRLWVYSCVVVPCIPHLLDSLLLTNIWFSISSLFLFILGVTLGCVVMHS